MKKLQYIQPTVEVNEISLVQMLADSVTGSGEATIGWGGSDDNGEIDPNVKGESWTDIWE
jgi:hypothetical protein